MLVDLVNFYEIINAELVVSILVELLVRLSNHLLSGHVHWSSDGSKEFIVGDGAIAVNIKVVEQGGYLTLVEAKHVVITGLGEFVLVKTL